MTRLLVALLLLGAWTRPVLAQTLQLLDEVPWTPLRANVQWLLRGLEQAKAPLPAATEQSLRTLLAEPAPKDTEAAVTAVQKTLDPHCLLAVSINPESRVKAARGPAVVELRQDRATVVLIKVHNDAGVTHPLAVTGPHLREEGQPAEGRWLSAAVIATPPDRKLSGQRLEYVLLRLTPHEAGKREATFKFDVGQGSQDLGFRAEVPMLFKVRP
jgi:hypothetical protein